MTSNPPTDPTHGLSVQQADALWDAVAIPGPQEPTFPVQHERVCRAVAGILDELAPATPSVSAVDQTTRDRIRRVLAQSDGFDFDSLEPHDYQIQAAALLAVLPPPADRAAVLRDAADRYEEILARANTGQDPRYWTAVRDITLGLRRMADEAQQPAVGARQPDTQTPKRASRWGVCDGCGAAAGPDCDCPPDTDAAAASAVPGRSAATSTDEEQARG